MSHDTDAMVRAHRAGRQLYWNEAGKEPPAWRLTLAQLASDAYATLDERVAFISGYVREKERATKQVPS